MKKKNKLSLNTRLVRSGIDRSKFNETSEALYLTSGFTYNSAEEAEACFGTSQRKIRRISMPANFVRFS